MLWDSVEKGSQLSAFLIKVQWFGMWFHPDITAMVDWV